MKQKGIKRLILCLIPLMLAFFTLSAMMAYKPAVADGSVTYPFRTGTNAFAYGQTWTTSYNNWTRVIYHDDDGAFTLSGSEGYLAVQMSTVNEVGIWSSIWDTSEHFNSGKAYFVSEAGVASTLVYQEGRGHVIPAGSTGMLVLPQSEFGTVAWSSFPYLILNVQAGLTENANISIKLGEAGYYESATDTTLEKTTTFVSADDASHIQHWEGTTALTPIPFVEEDVIVAYPFKTGTNAFAYGKTWTTEHNNWTLAGYKPNGSTVSIPANSKIAFQISTENEVAFWAQIAAGAAPYYSGNASFIDEQGEETALTYVEGRGHVIPAGSTGMFVINVAEFDSTGLDLTNATLFVLNLQAGLSENENVKLGELGYYTAADASDFAFISTFENANDEWKIVTWGDPITSTLTPIPYVDESQPIAYPFRTGEYGFAYGALWSNMTQTDGDIQNYHKAVFNLAEKFTLSSTGYVAIQVETDKLVGIAFSAFDEDNTEEDLVNHTATIYFVPEDGETVVSYESAYGNINLEAGSKGMIVVPVSALGDADEITAMVVTINTRWNGMFNLKLGEIAYYESETAEPQMIFALNSLDDFRRFYFGKVEGATDTFTMIDGFSVEYVSISTSGDIGLNFYVEMPEGTESVEGVMTMEGKDGVACQGVSKDGYFVFTCSVLPKEYKNQVTLTINGVTAITTSVEGYVQGLQSVEGFEDAKALANALVEYCEAVRVFFDDNETVTDKVAFSADLSAFKGTVTDNDNNVTILGTTLLVEEKTTINVYFTTAMAIDEVEVSETANVVLVDADKNLYVAQIKNIAGKALDEVYTIEIGGDVVTFGALSYAEYVIGNAESSAELYNVAATMYNYNVVANAYFGA
ncbi:MAG: hypothetical protein E7369_02975 [Clostridiales bacterium]|nr:hypothetical protein [Clostridiales bacterium]